MRWFNLKWWWMILLPIVVNSNSTNCTLNEFFTYASCTNLQGLPSTSSLTLFYTMEPSLSNSNNTVKYNSNITLHIGLESDLTQDRWIALGFPTTPGQMIGATAIILSLSSFFGVVLRDYYLGGKTPKDIVTPGHLQISNQSIIRNQLPIQAALQINLQQQTTNSASLPIIYATGPVDPSSNSILYHNYHGTDTLNLTASGHVSSSSYTNSDIHASVATKRNVHAWLMVVGWTLLITGGVIGRSFRTLGTQRWFQIHRALQLLGIACIISALIVIFSALEGRRTTYHIHYNIGIAACTLAFAQIVNALFKRPHLNSKYRRLWALMHHWIGRCSLVLGIANIYYGMIQVKEVGSWGVITFSVILGLILGIGAVKESVEYLMLPPPAVVREWYYLLDDRGRGGLREIVGCPRIAPPQEK